MKKADNKNKLLDFKAFSRSIDEVLGLCTNRLAERGSGVNGAQASDASPLVIFTPNSEQLVQAYHDISFGIVLGEADILLPDGMGVVWASHILGLKTGVPPLDQRIAGIEVAEQIVVMAGQLHKNALIVGGRDYQGALSTRIRADQSESWSHVLWHQGYTDVTNPTQVEEQVLVSYIRKTKPSVIFVAFGAPYQERWIVEHRELLAKSGVAIAMVVGGAFDVLLGKTKRAPLWMRQVGLEWLFRLTQEPWRWKRQLRLIEFIWLVVGELLKKN